MLYEGFEFTTLGDTFKIKNVTEKICQIYDPRNEQEFKYWMVKQVIHNLTHGSWKETRKSKINRLKLIAYDTDYSPI